MVYTECVFIVLWSTKLKRACNTIGCLQVVRMYSFMREIKYTLYVLFETENNKYYKRNKTCSPFLHTLVKASTKFERIFELVKTLNWVSGFCWSALELSQTFASVFTKLSEVMKNNVLNAAYCSFSNLWNNITTVVLP